MIMGSQSGPNGVALQPWKMLVYNEALRYYLKFGYVPEQLTPEVVAAGRDVTVGELDYELLDELRSPLTNDYPILNSSSFSAGNVYLRLLTDEEKTHIATYSPSHYRQWFRNERPGEAMELLAGHSKGESTEILAVFYMRLYGWNEVIDTSIITTGR